MFTTGLAEIVLIVSDVQASASFYREVVGLTPSTEPSDDWAWFWTGEPPSSPRIAVHRGSLLYEEHSPHAPADRWGYVHYAFTVPRENLEAAAQHVRDHGVEVYGPQHFEWMNATSYYFYDPDGNLLEFWSPNTT